MKETATGIAFLEIVDAKGKFTRNRILIEKEIARIQINKFNYWLTQFVFLEKCVPIPNEI